MFHRAGVWRPDLLLELALLPGMLLSLALPGEVVVVHATLGQGDEEVGTVVPQI